jgi:hypothetical protein
MCAQRFGHAHQPAHEVNGLVADNDGTLVGFAHYRVCATLGGRVGVVDDLFVAEGPAGRYDNPIDAIKVRAAEQGHSVVR